MTAVDQRRIIIGNYRSGGNIPAAGYLKNLVSADTTLDELDDAAPPAYTPPGSTSLARMLLAWSNTCLLGDYVYITGGGHDDYYGNEVYRHNLLTAQWSVIRDQSPNLIVSQANTTYQAFGPYGLYADGAPLAQHNYDQIQAVPATVTYPSGQLIIAVRSGFNGETNSTSSYAYALDLANPQNSWRQSTNSCFMGTGYTTAIYMPRRRKLLRFGQGNYTGQCAYLDPDSLTFTTPITISESFRYAGDDLVSGLYPDGELVFQRCTYSALNEIWVYDPSENRRYLLTTTGTGPTGSEETGIEWCPPLRKFFCYQLGQSKVWTLTPDPANPIGGTATWATETFNASSDAPATPSSINVTSNQRANLFRWWDGGGCFYVCGKVNAPAQLYKPVGL